MFFNIKNRNFFYLLLFPSSAVIFGGISFYFVDQIVDEPSINNIEDAFWLTITTMTTVGYGEIAPATTEGRIVAVVLLFAGILTFFGFLSTIASKIIESLFAVKTKEKSNKGTEGSNKSKEKNKNKKGEREGEGNMQVHVEKDDTTKELLKNRIDNLDLLDKKEFANLVIKLTEYYQINCVKKD